MLDSCKNVIDFFGLDTSCTYFNIQLPRAESEPMIFL